MAFEIWPAKTSLIHGVPKEEFLYVRCINRSRPARSTIIYELNRETWKFDYRVVFLSTKNPFAKK